MKVFVRSALTVLLLCSCGCTAATADAAQETTEADIETQEGTVESVENGNVQISYQPEDSTTTVTKDVPSTAIVLKENTTLHCDDLKENESVKISFAKGEISVIEVLPDEDQPTADAKQNSDQQAADSSSSAKTDASSAPTSAASTKTDTSAAAVDTQK